MTIESFPAGDSARIEHRSSAEIVRVEHIVVRAKLGGRGIVYDLVFAPIDGDADSPLPALPDGEIMQRFVLLGVAATASTP